MTGAEDEGQGQRLGRLSTATPRRPSLPRAYHPGCLERLPLPWMPSVEEAFRTSRPTPSGTRSAILPMGRPRAQPWRGLYHSGLRTCGFRYQCWTKRGASAPLFTTGKHMSLRAANASRFVRAQKRTDLGTLLDWMPSGPPQCVLYRFTLTLTLWGANGRDCVPLYRPRTGPARVARCQPPGNPSS